MKNEEDIIREIEQNLRILQQKAETIEIDSLETKWIKRVREEPGRFINSELTIKKDILRNFRKLSVFVPDVPNFNPTLWNPKNILGGGRRGARRLLRDSINVIIEHGYGPLLKKYPCSPVGNPNTLTYKGYKSNDRWSRHIYLIELLKRMLGEKIKNNFVALDIGSSYGIFSHLLKNEFAKSHCILLDFPEQLALAHYFLAMNNPGASIASFGEVLDISRLDRDFFERYDFILIPLNRYRNIFAQSVDLITNFVSFAEMNRHWFEYYTKNEPFLSTRYFFIVNRFQSAPEYNSDLTILDYHLEQFKRLHFAICSIIEHTYRRKFLFFYNKLGFSSQFFEFIGERTGL